MDGQLPQKRMRLLRIFFECPDLGFRATALSILNTATVYSTIAFVSDAQTPRAPIDPNELRRCITLCFSPKDLRSFAEKLGVSNLGSWDRGVQDGAREVVRHFERLGTLDQLVAKLAEAKPLMEWPGAPAPIAVIAVVPTVVETISPLASTPPSDAPSADAPPAIDTAAVAPVPPAAPPKPFGLTIPAPEPVLRDPFAPAWPGTSPSATTNSKRPEERKAAPIVAAIMVLVTFVAMGIFFAVRVSKTPERQSMEIVAGRPLRPNGPARMAADAMKRSLESLARGCDLELPRTADIDVWLFSAAYAQCGTRLGISFPPPGLRVDNPRSLNAPDDLFDAPSNAPSNAPTNNTPRQTNPNREPAGRPAPAPAPAKPAISDGCIEKCGATKRQCNRSCGSEPTSSSEYDRWQGCQTQCLSAASRCQLACQ